MLELFLKKSSMAPLFIWNRQHPSFWPAITWENKIKVSWKSGSKDTDGTPTYSNQTTRLSFQVAGEDINLWWYSQQRTRTIGWDIWSTHLNMISVTEYTMETFAFRTQEQFSCKQSGTTWKNSELLAVASSSRWIKLSRYFLSDIDSEKNQADWRAV